MKEMIAKKKLIFIPKVLLAASFHHCRDPVECRNASAKTFDKYGALSYSPL